MPKCGKGGVEGAKHGQLFGVRKSPEGREKKNGTVWEEAGGKLEKGRLTIEEEQKPKEAGKRCRWWKT